MKIIDTAEHYDNLIDDDNDPIYDNDAIKAYMNKWDGDIFIDQLNLNAAKNVLEIGVGTGRLAIRVIEKCKHFVGIDISKKTISKARKNLINFSNSSFIYGDFIDYRFVEKFDIVYSSLTFLHIKERAILRVKELLNDGGRFVLSIDKEQTPYLLYNGNKIITFPDTPNSMLNILIRVGFKILSCTEIEFAHIIVAQK